MKFLETDERGGSLRGRFRHRRYIIMMLNFARTTGDKANTELPPTYTSKPTGSVTYGHRPRRIGHPVRSVIHKQALDRMSSTVLGDRPGMSSAVCFSSGSMSLLRRAKDSTAEGAHEEWSHCIIGSRIFFAGRGISKFSRTHLHPWPNQQVGSLRCRPLKNIAAQRRSAHGLTHVTSARWQDPACLWMTTGPHGHSLSLARRLFVPLHCNVFWDEYFRHCGFDVFSDATVSAHLILAGNLPSEDTQRWKPGDGRRMFCARLSSPCLVMRQPARGACMRQTRLSTSRQQTGSQLPAFLTWRPRRYLFALSGLIHSHEYGH